MSEPCSTRLGHLGFLELHGSSEGQQLLHTISQERVTLKGQGGNWPSLQTVGATSSRQLKVAMLRSCSSMQFMWRMITSTCRVSKARPILTIVMSRLCHDTSSCRAPVVMLM